MKKVLLLILLTLFFSCSRDNKEKRGEGEKEQVNIAAVEGDRIFTDKLIKNFYLDIEDRELNIVFYEAQERRDTRNLLSFSPNNVKGTYRWKDDYTLVYQFTKVDLDSNYKVDFSLKEYLRKDYRDLSFHINFQAPKITNLSLNRFQLSSEHYLELIVDFDRAVSQELINSNMNIELPRGNNRRRLQIEKVEALGNRSNRYKIRTSRFSEDIERQKLMLSFFNQEIEEYFSYNTEGLRSYNFREGNDRFTLYLNFNSEITQDIKDIKSYINIDGLNDFYGRIIGNALVINGNFISGQDYEVRVFSPFANLRKDEIFKVKAPNLQPVIEFNSDGVYLADSENKRVRLRSRNLSGLNLSIKKVDSRNMRYFINNYGLGSGTRERTRYDSYNLVRFGTELYSQKINLSQEKNTWIETDIDLSVLGDKYDKAGIYLIEVSFNPEDILVPIRNFEDEEKNRDAYNNYSFADYLYRNGHISKTVILSDIGIISKKTSDRLFVYTSSISTGEALEEVEVSIVNHLGTRKSYSNKDGIAIFNIEDNSNWGLIFAEKNGELSFVNQYRDYIDYSLADNSGINRRSGIDAYLYTERGVYRPGDNLYISTILFEQDKKLPDNMPVKLKVYTPEGRLYKELEAQGGQESLYTFELETELSDPTGNWRMELYMGNMLIKTQYIPIETIVPPVIRVENTLSSPRRDILKAQVFSEYLFGAPSKELNYNMQLELRLAENPFEAYRNFTFVDETLEDSGYNNQHRSGSLDNEGRSAEEFQLNLTQAPFKLNLLVTTDVFQRDGRKVTEADSYIYDYYTQYAGIEKFNGFGEIGQNIKLKSALLDKDGNALEGLLTYNIYRNDTYWWWDYSSFDSYRKHYKMNDSTILIENGEIKAGELIDFTLEDYGNYYVEVVDIKGHRAGTFVRSGFYSFGAGSRDSFMKLELDKKSYNIGDRAQVFFQANTDAYAIINIERGDEILESRRVKVEEGRNSYSFKIKDNYFPGVHLNIIVLQNLRQKPQEVDIRLQGLQYIAVDKSDKKLESKLLVREVYNEPRNIDVGVSTSRPNTAFTLAVVDEGLLSLTRYQSPDAYSYFYGKERYNILNYDNYRHILNLEKSNAHQTLVPGGGEYRMLSSAEMMDMKSDAGVNEVKRFKAISYFQSGVTDEDGHAMLNFELDEYMGQLRFMLVTAKEGAFGSDSKSARVRGDVVMYPGLPRTIAPNDIVVSNLNLFINEAKDRNAKVGIKVEGPLVLLSPDEIELDGSKVREENLEFKIKALDKTGVGKITYYFESGDFRREVSTDIAINTQAPYISYSEEFKVEANDTVEFRVNTEAVKNSGEASMRVSRYPLYNLYGRLQYLIRYPYGCLEQRVSAIFPQLYIDKFINLSNKEWEEIRTNINEGIRAIERFQLPNGSLSYWENENHTNEWSTNYAHYFLLEAKRAGYYVPNGLLERLGNYQFNMSNNTRDLNLVNIHRLYVLALAQQANINAMNYYRQNKLRELGNREKFLLAGAYHLAGYKGTAENIIRGLSFQVGQSYWEDNFGSELRDKAIILDVLSRMKRDDETDALNRDILEKLAGRDWHSTQTIAYSLVAVSNYREDTSNNEELKYRYSVEGRSYERSFTSANELIDLGAYMGQKVEVENLSNKALYINYLFQGKMDIREQMPYARELRLSVKYYDDDGNPIDNLKTIERGRSIWAVYKVEKQRNKRYNNLALYQNLPSGLEIENLRLSGSDYPSWVYSLISSQANIRNTDIRDDKIVWFFDMHHGTENFFVLKLNAVTKGQYFMPGAVVEAMYSNEIGSSLEGSQIIIE